MSDALVRWLGRRKVSHRFIYAGQRERCGEMLDHISERLLPGDRILDVGAGTCNMVELLREREFAATGLDVSDISYVPGIEPVLYDGAHMPFEDNTFDVALILTVLHHARDPVQVVREARRVAKRLIIIEDVYKNWFHKYVTWFWDSLLNLEFIGHPHTNKDDAGWRRLFDELDLNLVGWQERWSFGFMWQVTYLLERGDV